MLKPFVLTTALFLVSCSTTTVPPEDYDALTQSCYSDTCCMGSVEKMKLGGYRLAKDNTCPDGMKTDLIRCPGTKVWCIPSGNTN